MQGGIRPGYKQTEVGVIPQDWDVARIVDVASITTGSRNTQDRIDTGIYPFFVRSQTVERINSYSFDGEAVLTAGDGVGTGKIFHYINGKFDLHQRVYQISNFSPRLNGFFFYLYFASKFFDRIMSMTAKSSVDSVRREMIADMLMPLPTPDEQRAIAAALADADALIAAFEGMIAKKRDLKQAAMQHLLTGKTRLPGFSGEWEVKRLGEIGRALIGLTYSPADIRSFGTLVLRSSNIQNGVLAFDDNVYVDPDVAQSSLIEVGDLLICARNGSRDLIGKSVRLDGRARGMAFGAFMAAYRSEFNNFISLQFQSDLIKRQINEHLGATINQITNKSLLSFQVPLPNDRAEQTAIAEVLSDMDADLAALEAQAAKARAVKQGMMQELLTGRVRLV